MRGGRVKPSALVVPALLVLLALGISLIIIFLPRQAAAPAAPEGVTVLLPNDELSAVAMYQGALWAGGRQGLYRVDTETLQLQPVQLPDTLPRFQYVRDILVVQDSLWVAYDGGVARLLDGSWSVACEGFTDLRMTSLCPAPGGQAMWAGSYSGAMLISMRDMQVEKTLTAAEGLVSDMVNVIATDDMDNVWFGSYLERPGTGGLSILSPGGGFTIITDEDGLPHHDITALLWQNGEMLVGCGMLNRGGAARLAPLPGGGWQVQKTWLKADGLAGEKVRALFPHDDQLWFCSENDGVAIMEDGVFIRVLTKEDGLSDNEVKDIAQGADGTLYLASRYGLTCISPAGLQAMLGQ